jgi:transcriptional regulator with XRE-family HTH domain
MANKLYETRALQRVSQYVIALKTGIQQSRISLIENELVMPREDERKKIAKALGVKSEDVFPTEMTNV